MPKRVSKSSDKVGRLSIAKVRKVLREMRRERGPIVVPKGKIVLTNEMTASGRGLIAFRVPKYLRSGKPDARRRQGKETSPSAPVRKTVWLDPGRLEKARQILGASTDAETIERALELLVRGPIHGP